MIKRNAWTEFAVTYKNPPYVCLKKHAMYIIISLSISLTELNNIHATC
jgi:hypothetical protein